MTAPFRATSASPLGALADGESGSAAGRPTADEVELLADEVRRAR